MVLAFDVLSWILLVTGSLVLMTSASGMVRMPNFYNRLHAASVNDTFGPGLILLGLAFQATHSLEVMIKLALVLIFLVLTGPLSTHALAKAALENGTLPGLEEPDLGKQAEADGADGAGSTPAAPGPMEEIEP